MTTPAQRNYLLDLAAKRDAPKLGATPDERRAEMARLLDERDLSTREASAWIDRLKTYPYATQATAKPVDLAASLPDFTTDRAANDPPNRLRPNGGSGLDVRRLGKAGSNGKARYAIVDPADGVLKFIIVRHVESDESRWNGWTFVDIQAGPNTYMLGSQRPGETSTYKGKSLDLVGALVALDDDGLTEAMAAYGRELGYCGKCGSELTDETSRARGIGPYCGGRAGQSKPRDPSLPTIDELIEAVKRHAAEHYDRDGWDAIVECYDDDQLRDIIGTRVRTVAGAIKKVRDEIKPWNEKRKEIEATAF